MFKGPLIPFAWFTEKGLLGGERVLSENAAMVVRCIIQPLKLLIVLKSKTYFVPPTVDTCVGNVSTVDYPEHCPEIGRHVHTPAAIEVYPWVGWIFDLKQLVL
jgi:hypothetical protein